jgi:hypothetical protein
MESGDAMTFRGPRREVELEVSLGGCLHGVAAGRGDSDAKRGGLLTEEWNAGIRQVDCTAGVGCHGGWCARDRVRRRDSVGVVTVVRC